MQAADVAFILHLNIRAVKLSTVYTVLLSFIHIVKGSFLFEVMVLK